MSARIRVGLTLLALLLAGLAHTNALDQHGLRVTEAGLSRALVTFGVSRGLNGVISVVQGTEVAVEPVGIGMTFTPGQILDPVNDLVERFSTIVLVAGTAFGVQRVALEVTSTALFSWFCSILMLAAIVSLWWREKLPAWCANFIFKAAITVLIVRFAVPVLAIGGEAFYQAFLAPQFVESTEQLRQTSEQLGDMQAANSANEAHKQDDSLLASARRLVQSASSSLDVRKHIEDFKAAAETISEHAIRLMVVFIFQTVLLPLLSLWLVVKALKAVACSNFMQGTPH